ncbi:hypothetical protein CQ018_13090 [Arthrobacter sp. MYb227]|uniref:M50 family metallopeptidase n=1 Tax=Arthrobacter sp. MYb227 TaxID=1848601 RepID=UPI000CFCB704|nr:M50 family metallopeptidase [Arthrobacter sp. MYb227]PQZ91574.1 hypothetical protein CQ018_13090 [Arthrobacter sp. MYb227]
MQVLEIWWQAVLQGFVRSEPLSFTMLPILAVITLCMLLTVPRITWKFFGLYVTFVHELGHAFAALMTGRVVHGLKIGLDHSGELVSSGKPGFSALWSGFWGYPVPALAGTLLIGSSYFGFASAALSVGALILLVSLIFLRNWTGILVAVASAAIAQLLVVFTPSGAIAWVVLSLGLMLLIGGVRDLFKVLGVHINRRELIEASDAYLLSTRGWLPAWFWLCGFIVVVGSCVVASSFLLRLMLRT